MDLRIKRKTSESGVFIICLCLILLTQPVSAQFKHKWQAEVTTGTALSLQNKYYIKEGYPNLSIVGNLKMGITANVQLMRNLTNWAAAGGGIALTNFGAVKIPSAEAKKEFNLSAKTLNLSGRIYPLGRNFRLTPFLQTSILYGQVSLVLDRYTYTVDSLSMHPGNRDYPVLMRVIFSNPKASQKSNVVGFSGVAGAELLLKDAVGLNWQIGYHRYKTEQMQLLHQNLQYWDFRMGMFVRMFKSKRLY